MQNACKRNSPIIRSSQSESTLYMSAVSSSFGNTRTSKSLNHVHKSAVTHSDIRRYSRLGTSSQFESIDEDMEPANKTDSGVLSMSSKPSHITRIGRDAYMSLSSSSMLLEKVPLSYSTGISATAKRQLPKTISLIAGVFCFKIFESSDDPNAPDEDYCGKPLISCTISQPSFMVTQNIYDCVVNFSIFNLSVFLPTINKTPGSAKCLHLFPESFMDTMPGEITSTGIPPALLTYRAQKTKLKLHEIDIDFSKPLVITISERYIEKICMNLIVIYNSIRSPNTNSVSTSCPEPLCRKSKITLMKANTLNADRLNVKCNNIALKLTNHKDYECDLAFSDLKVNLKYLTRPEKCSAKFSLAAVYLRTKKKIFVHPIALKGSIEFLSEPWNRLPLTNVIVKFNVIQVDVSINIIRELKQAAEGIQLIANFAQQEIHRFQLLHLHEDSERKSKNRNSLRQLKCPSMSSFIQNNKSLKREEFYQDDLRCVLLHITCLILLLQFMCL